MMRIHNKGENEKNDDESHNVPCEFAQQLQNVRKSFEPPSSRTLINLLMSCTGQWSTHLTLATGSTQLTRELCQVQKKSHPGCHISPS